jgi:PAS domain S-box-containing protein
MVPNDDDVSVELAFDRAGVALSVTDTRGQLLHANAAFRELFGWSATDTIDISKITRPEDRDWTRTYIERIVRGDDDEFHSVKQFLRRDGTEFSGIVTIRPLHRDGHCVGIVGVVLPTEHRELVGDRRVSKLLEHNAGTITLIDSDGNVMETAGRYTETLGYPKEFWEARTIFDVLVPEDAQRVLAMRDDVLAEPGCVVTGDFTVVGAAGERHVLEATAVNLLADPDIEGIVITSRNVTDERATRAELTTLRDDAVIEADQRTRLVATVSHELRNPLHAITGLSELLASDVALPAKLHDLASSLHRQVTQLTRVTDDLLDTAQLEIGDGGLRAGPTRVRRVVDDVARLGRAAQHGGQVAVWATVADEVPAVVDTDGARLHQLLLNLVGNAVKFTDDGEVGISVTSTELGDGRLQLDITVHDTGRGIPPDDLDAVFQPFRMATNAGDDRGAGLGLAVASRIVAMLGGSIDVTSEVGRGSTFRVSFPVEVSAEPADAPVERRVSLDATDRPVVLVVEDNAVNQELARHQLDRLGMVAVVVTTAEEAIELAVERHFDAILMDHQLPGMNGRDATRELRRLDVTVPIVGMTASATAADEQACLDAGMNAFLAKPVGLDRLSSTLDALIARDAIETPTSTDTARGDSDHTPSAIDVDVLETLSAEFGNPAIVTGLIETFLGELERRQSAIAGEDPEQVAREAHTLKSSARLLGAVHLATVCEQVEQDPSRAPLVHDQAIAAERELRAWLTERNPEEAR